MATLFITTNADSGDGSLRALLAIAAEDDLIVADPTVFPRGTECRITLASALTITTSVEIGGNGRRIVLDGAGTSGRRVALQAPTVFNEVDFIGLFGASTGGAVYCATASEAAVFNGCLIVGCGGSAVMYAGNGVEVECNDCAIYGNKGTGSYVLIHQSGASSFTFNRCTRAYNLPATEAASGRTIVEVDCITTTGGFVSEPTTWDESQWTSTAWEAWNLRAPNSTGATTGAGMVDVDGNDRKSAGALGAWENIDADLYWLGLDAQGNEVANPSFASADGWTTTRWNCEDAATTAPTGQGLTLFVGDNVVFSGTLASGADEAGTLIVGGFAAVDATLGGQTLVLGKGSKLALRGAGTIVGEYDGGGAWTTEIDWDALELTTGATLTLKDCLLQEGGFTIASGQTIEIDGGAFYASVLQIGGTLAINGSVETTALDLYDGATVLFTGQDAFLTASDDALIGEATIGGSARGYFATPTGTDSSSATIGANVVECDYATATGFQARGASLSSVVVSWTTTSATGSPRLEVLEDGDWVELEYSESEVEYETNGTAQFRLFTGSGFLTATASPTTLPKFWTVAVTVDAAPSGEESEGKWSASVFGVAPQTFEEN